MINRLSNITRSVAANPAKASRFLLGTVFEESDRIGSWRRENGYITFNEGGFVDGTADRAEFSARTYYEVDALTAVLDDHQPEATRSLDVGSGYGRLSAWIANYAEDHHGVDPNAEMVEKARRLYPDATFEATTADALPYPDGHFDLAVSWTVLIHIPPGKIRETARELVSVLDDGGVLVACEETDERAAAPHVWVRSVAEYENIFEELTLIDTRERSVEPTYENFSPGGTIMVFEKS